MDVKRALAAYIIGRSRGWEAARKAEVAAHLTDDGGERADRSSRPPVSSLPGPSRRSGRFGVPIPDSLVYDRGPGTWRYRLDGGSHD